MLNSNSRLLPLLDELLTDPVFFIDVGCSGGIDPKLRQFEPRLAGIGIDPLVAEIHRLADSEANPAISYVEAWVDSDGRMLTTESSGYWWPRSSAAAVAEMQAKHAYTQKHFNSGAAVVYADQSNYFTLGYLLEEAGNPSIDFLKIDTDGHDVRVLRSGADHLAKSPPLLALVECSLNGDIARDDSTFAGVDAILRPVGMTVLDLQIYRYTRRALPGRWSEHNPAQTVGGPAAWGDVIYVDDPLYEEGKLDTWLASGRLQRCLKLCVLYEMAGFPDCAAELIVRLRDHPASAAVADWTLLLDTLVPANPWNATTYAEFIAGFETQPLSLAP
jgi:hypothetical protein